MVIVLSGIFLGYLGVSLLAAAGGWYKLSRMYKGRSQKTMSYRRWCSAYLNWLVPMPYRQCLTIELCVDGLGLSVFWPYRLFHPPIFIPWRALRSDYSNSESRKHVHIDVAGSPVTISFYGRAATFLRKELPNYLGSAPIDAKAQ